MPQAPWAKPVDGSGQPHSGHARAWLEAEPDGHFRQFGICRKYRTCGWVGPYRDTLEEAQADAAAHEAEANARDGFAPPGEPARPR